MNGMNYQWMIIAGVGGQWMKWMVDGECGLYVDDEWMVGG